jgi:glutathione synthase/RimK-type ligase-like ATP-grasp enzyme
MRIYYDSDTRYWFQTSVTDTVTFGGNKTVLPWQKTDTKHTFSIQLNSENHHAGPIVGIITARKADGTIAGNSALFIKLQKRIMLQGGISYIFTSEDVQNNWINGYMFLPEMNQWKKIKVPLPDLVYNRIPFRNVEQEEQCQAFFSILKVKNIPFFNPCFLDKYKLYTLLKTNPKIMDYLPETMLINDQQTLYDFFEEQKGIYLKPSHAAKGKGIYRLSFTESPILLMEGLKGNDTYPTFLDFWEKWKKELIEKQYLAQKEVNSAKFEGKRFDLRVLAHASGDGYMVTGVGVRQAMEQDITTHVPNGGKLLPYHLFQTDELDRFITYAVNEIGETLTKSYGFFGEFSIDLGISDDGDYFLYEVNSKPMSFDEIEIEDKKLNQLCSLFFQLTKFPHTHEIQANSAE